MSKKFGPKTTDHPSIGEPCPVCGVAFTAGDYTALEMTHAADLEEARKAQAGQAFTAVAVEVHWDCRSQQANPQDERRFITDMGQETVCTVDARESMTIPRYAVWGDTGRGKPEVIETHNDLAKMQRDHGVPRERVILMTKPTLA